MVTLTLPGPFGPPTTPVYASEEGEILKVLVDAVVGGVDVDVEAVGGEMINVTGMSCGWSPPKTVMDAEYVPTARPERFAWAVTVFDELADAAPFEGDRVSHDDVVLTLQVKTPCPRLEMFTV